MGGYGPTGRLGAPARPSAGKLRGVEYHAVAPARAMAPPASPGSLPNVKLMVRALLSQDTVKAQNAAGVLAYLAISRKDCLKAIAQLGEVAPALSTLIGSDNVGLQHNAALLIGQLSTESVFRREMVKQHNTLP